MDTLGKLLIIGICLALFFWILFLALRRSRKIKQAEEIREALEETTKAPEEKASPTPLTPATGKQIPAWGWALLITLLAVGVWLAASWWTHTSLRHQTASKVQTPAAQPKKLHSFSPLTLDATSFKKASQGVEDEKATPPEVTVREGGEVFYSFVIGERLPEDKSVIVTATLVPEAGGSYLPESDPVFSIGESLNQKIILRGGPQEIRLGCPARELRMGENFLSYRSKGNKFKILNPLRVELSP